MSRVFIIGPGHHNYDAASKYGTRVDVLDAKVNPFDTDALAADLVEEMFHKLGVGPEDFIVLGGNAVLNAIAIGLMANQFGTFKLLVYGAKQRDYTARTVDLGKIVSDYID